MKRPGRLPSDGLDRSARPHRDRAGVDPLHCHRRLERRDEPPALEEADQLSLDGVSDTVTIPGGKSMQHELLDV